MTTEIRNMQDAHNTIESLRSQPLPAQLRQLKNHIAKLELNQMYYEQKESANASLRCQGCVEILNSYMQKLHNE